MNYCKECYRCNSLNFPQKYRKNVVAAVAVLFNSFLIINCCNDRPQGTNKFEMIYVQKKYFEALKRVLPLNTYRSIEYNADWVKGVWAQFLWIWNSIAHHTHQFFPFLRDYWTRNLTDRGGLLLDKSKHVADACLVCSPRHWTVGSRRNLLYGTLLVIHQALHWHRYTTADRPE